MLLEIKTEADYKEALAIVNEMFDMDLSANHIAEQFFEKLLCEIIRYEELHYRIEA